MATIRKHRHKYQVQVRRKGVAPSTKTFTLLADAKEWARHQERLADRAELGPDRKVLERTTLANLVQRYVDEMVPDKKGGEIEAIVLKAFLRHRICKRRLSELTTADFATYRDERLKTISTKSLKRQIAPLSHMFEVARLNWSLPIRSNPLRDLSLKVTDNKRDRRLRDGEFENLIEAGRRTRNRLLIPIVRLALETAMRRGEIIALRFRDVDIERCTATIRDSKNGHSRTIPLSSIAIATLETTTAMMSIKSKTQNERIFPVTPVSVRLGWDKLTKRANIDDLHFHDLRHEAISRFFEKGLTVPEVASISGHRDIRMLLRYAHADKAQLAKKLSSQPL
ncbi:site-specific integrase [Mesorhizobium sp. M0924]|uniref:site-specific integrase n=1 Tax=unclassified Mesorhizobium TaxID=325217 RepID=UPI0033362834